MDQPERAAVYYGYLFDLLVEPKDETKALAIFNRFPEEFAVSATAGTHRAIRVPATETEPSRRSDGTILQGRGNVQGPRARRRRAVLLGTHGAARPRQYVPAVESWRKRRRNWARMRWPRERFCVRGKSRRPAAPRRTRLKLLGRAYTLAPQERSVALLYAEAKLAKWGIRGGGCAA